MRTARGAKTERKAESDENNIIYILHTVFFNTSFTDEHSFVNFYDLIIAEKIDLSTQMFTKFDFLVPIFGL